MKIYLIGMPGSGKTTLGAELATALMVPFVDLDAEIEKREQHSVQEIFSQTGESHFRQVEAEILREWAASTDSFVMATGGGAPCYYQGIDVINSTGLSVFLDVSMDQLVDRLKAGTIRPLLNEGVNMREKTLALRRERLAVYSKAHITLTNPTAADLIDKVRARK